LHTDEGMLEAAASTENARPWVSFCIATYLRQQRLKTTLESIARQSFGDFEVVVCDNDPAGSSRDVVAAMGDARFVYFCNEINVGMIRNFNAALSHARGKYVVLVSDDDPVYPGMLATLKALSEQYPGYGAYYGTCDVDLQTEGSAAIFGVKVGKKSFLSSGPAGSVRVYSKERFPAEFLSRKIFPYTLWSTGIVDRNVVQRMGGVPDYGSPFLADFAYIGLAGSYAGFVAVNTSLGYQAVHAENSGFVEPHDMKQAASGFHDWLSQRLGHRPDWLSLRAVMERFIGTYLIGNLLAMRKFVQTKDPSSATAIALAREKAEILSIPYVHSQRYKYHLLALASSFPRTKRLAGMIKRMIFRTLARVG